MLREIIEYCNDIVNGKINACKKHKWACERFLLDLERQGQSDFPYIWNDEKAEKIVKWFSYLRHSKGILEKQPIILNNWQKFVMCNIYGWVHKDTGYRRFKKVYVQVAKKNSKSQMMGGAALYDISALGVNAAEAYCLGVDRGQAKVVFDECKLMLNNSLLSSKFDYTDKSPYIRHTKSGSFITALSKDSGKTGDGKNPSFASVDEYHLHKTDSQYSIMDRGMVARQQPLIIAITTAGEEFNDESPCYSTYNYCSKVLNPLLPDVTNDEYFIMICELEPDDDIKDESNWIKANPVLATYEVGFNSLRGDLKIALEDEKKMSTFLTKNMNIWVKDADKVYIKLENWKKGEKIITFDNFKGKNCYIGVDLSSTGDLTSIGFVFPYIEQNARKYAVFQHSFMPSARLQERMRKDKTRYDLFIKRDLLTLTETNMGLIIDYNYVVNYIEEIVKKYNITVEMICYDTHQAGMFASTMSDLGYTLLPIVQSAKSLNDATVDFRNQVNVENIFHAPDGLLDIAVDNAETEMNSFREIKIKKFNENVCKKIDPIASIINAYKMAMVHKLDSIDESKYFTDEYLNRIFGDL